MFRPEKCPDCQTEMVQLFLLTSFVCPNECDLGGKKEEATGHPRIYLHGAYDDFLAHPHYTDVAGGQFEVPSGLTKDFWSQKGIDKKSNSLVVGDNIVEWIIVSGSWRIDDSWGCYGEVVLVYNIGQDPLIIRRK